MKWVAYSNIAGEEDMKKKDKQDYNFLLDGLWRASQMRTFPNRRFLLPFESSSINQIGKLLEYIYKIARDIRDRKKPRKEISLLRKCRIALEHNLIQK